MTCEIISSIPTWYLLLVFVGCPAIFAYAGYKLGYATGQWDQRGDDLEQFVETGNLSYGWKKKS